MIKNLFLFFAALGLFATLSKAQVSSVTGQYLQDNNILLNPGFESGIGKWVNSAGTFTADYTNFIQGKASGKIVLSSQALAFTQDSTSFVTALADGVQGLVSVYIKSQFPAKVCSRSAGSTITTNCVDVVGNNRWSLYKVPSILGATSNGISVNTDGTSVTGTIYIDESFVGVTNLFADVDASKIAGESFFPSAANCAPTRASTTIGAFNTDPDCVAPTIVQQNLGQWQTTDSNGPIQIINNLPLGKYVAEFELGSVMSGAANTGFAINDGTTTCAATPGGSPTSVAPKTISCSFSYNNAGNRTFQIYAASSSGTLTISLDDLLRGNVRFKLYYFGSSSVYTSTNADTDWASCGHTTSSFTGFGTVSNIETQCKRQGGDLLMKGKFTSGVSTAVEARISLPIWNGVQLSSEGTTRIPSIQQSGLFSANISTTAGYANDIAALIEPSVTYFTIRTPGSSSLTKANGSVITGSSATPSFNVRIPINGWNNSNIIIGQFEELMTVPNVTKPKTCYYAFGGASATLASPTVCSTGTCVEIYDSCATGSAPTFSSTGVYNTFSFASGTFANSSHINCDCVSYDTTTATSKDCRLSFTTGNVPIITNISGGLTLSNIYTTIPASSANTASNSYVQIRCEGNAP